MSLQKKRFESLDEYIADFPPRTQEALQEIRRAIQETIPDGTEAITYNMPTFKLNGRNLVHFSGYKNHVGFYPTPTGIEPIETELKPYASGKASAKFPLDKPMPVELVKKMTAFWAQQGWS